MHDVEALKNRKSYTLKGCNFKKYKQYKKESQNPIAWKVEVRKNEKDTIKENYT